MIRCKNPGCDLEVKAKGTRQCSPCSQNKKRYGIDNPTRQRMLRDQDYKCKICKTEIYFEDRFSGRSHSAVIDHCHTTNKVRGILCCQCNHGLGKFYDDPIRLARAISYLSG